MTDSPIAILERWERHGGVWRARRCDALAVVELCSCHGEPVDELRSADAALLAYLRRRPRSDAET